MKLSSDTIQFFLLPTVLLIGLKFANHINWEWHWVLGPLWVPFAVAVVGYIVIEVFMLITRLICGKGVK